MPDRMTKQEADVLRDTINDNYVRWDPLAIEAAKKVLADCPVELLIEEVQRRNIAVPECCTR